MDHFAIMSDHRHRYRRRIVPVEFKLNALKRIDNGETIQKVASDLDVSVWSVNKWMRTKSELEKWSSDIASSVPFNKRKERTSGFKELNEAVFSWFKQNYGNGNAITGKVIKEKALLLSRDLCRGERTFTASNGWLSRWKQNYGIPKLYQKRNTTGVRNGNDDCIIIEDKHGEDQMKKHYGLLNLYTKYTRTHVRNGNHDCIHVEDKHEEFLHAIPQLYKKGTVPLFENGNTDSISVDKNECLVTCHGMPKLYEEDTITSVKSESDDCIVIDDEQEEIPPRIPQRYNADTVTLSKNVNTNGLNTEHKDEEILHEILELNEKDTVTLVKDENDDVIDIEDNHDEIKMISHEDGVKIFDDALMYAQQRGDATCEEITAMLRMRDLAASKRVKFRIL